MVRTYSTATNLLMEKMLKKSFPVLLLLFGTFILLVSLLSANRNAAGDTSRLLAQKVYFNQTILPDNIFYPLLMVGDRAKLLTADGEAKILLRIEFSARRYGYAVQLIEKEQPVLALTTLTKSQKYLFIAGNEVLANPDLYTPETIQVVQTAFANSLTQLPTFKQQMANTDTQTIDDLHRDTQIIYQKLSTLDLQKSR